MRKIIFIVALAVFLFSATSVLKHRQEMRIGAEQAETVVQAAVTPASKQSEREEGPNTNDTPGVSAPIQVDFDALFAKNQDVVAWLYCPDTPINYPVVQAPDNDYYLHRLLDGSQNAGGTLFMDYRNAADLSDWNSVIYGHNMSNDSMFGTLPDYETQSYFEAHPQMFLLTPEQDYVIEWVAFTPDAVEKARFLENWLRSSDFVSEMVPTAEDRLITLSTCSYAHNDARYVLIGRLKECTQ